MFKQIFATTVIVMGTSAHAEGQWTFGIFGVGTSGIYAGEGDTAGIAPLLSYDTEALHIGLDGVSYDVYRFDQGHVGVALGYRAAPDFPDDAALFEGLKREDAIEIGLQSHLEFGAAYVSLNTMTDVTDAHGGTEANAALGYTMAPGNFAITTEVGARFRDAKLNQFLYGVSASEANATRTAYSAQSTTTAFANLTVAYPITDTVSAVGAIEYQDLGSNTNSPLVDKSDVVEIGLGVVMSF